MGRFSNPDLVDFEEALLGVEVIFWPHRVLAQVVELRWMME
jgi:hypothetical protein